MLEKIRKDRAIYLFLLPTFLYFIIFLYYPIVREFIMSVQDFKLIGHSPFIGFEHYSKILHDKEFWDVLRNTLVIGGGNLIVGLFSQLVLALLLNEVSIIWFKRFIQTVVYMPNLFSWVVVGGIWILLLAPDNGLVNEIIKLFGGQPISFMTKESYAWPIFILTNTWKTVGYGCIIFLAAITNIDPQLYEAAYIDGAGRWLQTIHITLPGLYDTIKTVFLLNLMGVLNIFDQSYMMTNPAIINKTDVIMTYTYRTGIQQFNMGYAAAVSFIVLVMTLVLALGFLRTSKFISSREM